MEAIGFDATVERVTDVGKKVSGTPTEAVFAMQGLTCSACVKTVTAAGY